MKKSNVLLTIYVYTLYFIVYSLQFMGNNALIIIIYNS